MISPKQLIKRYCQKHDQAAFNLFYRQQADRLWRYLVARGCNPADAYDLLSESFLKFIKAICRDPRAPVGFLYRIASNLYIDSHRRSRSSPVVIDMAAVEAAGDAAGSSTEALEKRQYIRHLMDRLPKNEQNLLLMRYWIGLTHKEIAISTGLPEGTVRRQAAAALKSLKQNWEKD